VKKRIFFSHITWDGTEDGEMLVVEIQHGTSSVPMVFIAFCRDSPTLGFRSTSNYPLNHQTQTVAACAAGNQFSLPGLSSQGPSDSEVEIAPNRREQ